MKEEIVKTLHKIILESYEGVRTQTPEILEQVLVSEKIDNIFWISVSLFWFLIWSAVIGFIFKISGDPVSNYTTILAVSGLGILFSMMIVAGCSLSLFKIKKTPKSVLLQLVLGWSKYP